MSSSFNIPAGWKIEPTELPHVIAVTAPTGARWRLLRDSNPDDGPSQCLAALAVAMLTAATPPQALPNAAHVEVFPGESVAMGCHCDLGPNGTPDGCVLDVGRPEDCARTRSGKITSREDCDEWKPIRLAASVASRAGMEPAPGEVSRLAEACHVIESLVKRIERNECQHENTHRGGAIWTICDDCDEKWADDRGGFKRYKRPIELLAADKFIATMASTPASGVADDTKRLDWLDQQSRAYGFADVHEGNVWEVKGGYLTIRDAIDHECAAPASPATDASEVPASADRVGRAVTQAERDLLAERRRQVEAEGYSADHDAAHGTSELSLAAAAYSLSSVHGFTAKSLSPWPWETSAFKPKHPYRDLERAGALVLAAMECWQRRFSKNLASDQAFIESRRLAAPEVPAARQESGEAGILTNIGTDRPRDTSLTFASPEIMRDALAAAQAAPVTKEAETAQEGSPDNESPVPLTQSLQGWKDVEVVARIRKSAGKTVKEVRNPGITARDSIILANYIAEQEAVIHKLMAAPPSAANFYIDEEMAGLLRQTIGDDGEPNAIRLEVGDGHSGFGLYVSLSDYPEEGAIQLVECAVPAIDSARAAIGVKGGSRVSIKFDFERTESNGLVLVPKTEALLRIRDAYKTGRAAAPVAAEAVGEIVGTEKRGFALMTVVRWEPGFDRTKVGTLLYARPTASTSTAAPAGKVVELSSDEIDRLWEQAARTGIGHMSTALRAREFYRLIAIPAASGSVEVSAGEAALTQLQAYEVEERVAEVMRLVRDYGGLRATDEEVETAVDNLAVLALGAAQWGLRLKEAE